MESENDYMTVGDLVGLSQKKWLSVNDEYQRGVVWSEAQKKKLIDSVFRGYTLPLVYLHYKKEESFGMSSESYEVIDGQQRINALHEFSAGAWELFDPKKDAKEARFPRFIEEEEGECLWAGKKYEDLSEELREKFDSTEIPVVKIITDNSDEIRDLFVRLQAGKPLNSQEQRDAFPGDFNEYVLKVGGKAGKLGYQGHRFFTNMYGNAREDRGGLRQLVAQVCMLYFSRREKGYDYFCDVNKKSLDDYYYQNIDFDINNPEAQRLSKILDKLAVVFPNKVVPKMVGHDVIHLVLFVDSIFDDYVVDWNRLPEALRQFRGKVVESRQMRNDPYWHEYAVGTQLKSDKDSTIARRHSFYAREMRKFLGLTPKDPKRTFGRDEKNLLYFRQKEKCLVCGTAIDSIDWESAEVHHVTPHSQGGQTVIDNAALVHQKCHPRSVEDVESFKAKFHSLQKSEGE